MRNGLGRGRPGPLSGFTLVELLVATFIVATILAAAYHVFQTCLGLWKRGDAEREAMASARVFCAQLGQELTGVAVFEGSDGQFLGQAEQVTFTSLAPSRTSGENPEPCLRVSYQLGQQRGEGAVGSVERCQALAAGGMVLSNLQAPEVILAGVREFSLGYLAADSSDWSDKWEKRDELPAAVRVTMVLEGPVGRDGLAFRTTFSVPTGGRQTATGFGGE